MPKGLGHGSTIKQLKSGGYKLKSCSSVYLVLIVNLSKIMYLVIYQTALVVGLSMPYFLLRSMNFPHVIGLDAPDTML